MVFCSFHKIMAFIESYSNCYFHVIPILIKISQNFVLGHFLWIIFHPNKEANVVLLI